MTLEQNKINGDLAIKAELNKSVVIVYRPQLFINETICIDFLFELYDKYTAGLFAGEGKKRKK